jgi:hypothetical protein
MEKFLFGRKHGFTSLQESADTKIGKRLESGRGWLQRKKEMRNEIGRWRSDGSPEND